MDKTGLRDLISSKGAVSDSLELLAIAANVAVIIGLFIEYLPLGWRVGVHLSPKMPEWLVSAIRWATRPAKRRGLVGGPENEPRDDLLEFIGGILVTAGIALEIFCVLQQHRISADLRIANSELQNILDADAIGAQEKAATATEAAAKLGVTVDNLTQVAQTKAGEANLAIAALTEATAKANNKLGVIEQRVAHATRQDRFLSDDEARGMVAFIHHSPPMGFQLMVDAPPQDTASEQYRFGDQISRILKAGGWHTVDCLKEKGIPCLPMWRQTASDRGLLLGHSASSPEDAARVQAIIGYLQKLEVQCEERSYSDIPAGMIVVEAGIR